MAAGRAVRCRAGCLPRFSGVVDILSILGAGKGYVSYDIHRVRAAGGQGLDQDEYLGCFLDTIKAWITFYSKARQWIRSGILYSTRLAQARFSKSNGLGDISEKPIGERLGGRQQGGQLSLRVAFGHFAGAP